MPDARPVARGFRVNEHTNAMLERSCHRNLGRAQKRHLVPAEIARSTCREITDEIGRDSKDGADHILD
jgi:hypothetical protein